MSFRSAVKHIQYCNVLNIYRASIHETPTLECGALILVPLMSVNRFMKVCACVNSHGNIMVTFQTCWVMLYQFNVIFLENLEQLNGQALVNFVWEWTFKRISTNLRWIQTCFFSLIFSCMSPLDNKCHKFPEKPGLFLVQPWWGPFSN